MKLTKSKFKTSAKLLLAIIVLSFLSSIFSYTLSENSKMLRNSNEEKAGAQKKKPKTKPYHKSEYSVKITNKWSIDIARAYRDIAGLGYISDNNAKTQLEEIQKGPAKDTSKVSSLFKNLFELGKWEHVVTKTGDKTYHNHSFTIIRNLSLKKLVLTFAGSKKEQLKDEYDKRGGVPYSKELSHIKLMEYFRNLYFSSREEIKSSFLKAYDPKKIDQVIFVGHSLGGTIASIAAFDFLQEKVIKATAVSPVLITYGQPRTGNYAFANEIMKRVPIVFRHVNNYDLVIGVPACESKDKKCINEFGKDEIDKNFNDYEKSFEKYATENKLKDINKFFPYHFGGLILNKGDTEWVNCLDKSEVGPTDECRGTPSLEVDFHVYYYGYKVSDMWKPEDFPYEKDKENHVLSDKVDESKIIKGKLVWEDYQKNFSYFSLKKIVQGIGGTALRATGYVHGKKKF